MKSFSAIAILSLLFIHPATSSCRGIHWSCSLLGRFAFKHCHYRDGCSFNRHTNICEGTPTPCENFKTAELCSQHTVCTWDGYIRPSRRALGRAQLGVYEGTATTTLLYPVYEGLDVEPTSSREEATQHEFEFIILTPYSQNGISETNPFGFVASSSPDSTEGSIYFTSASIVTSPDTGSAVLDQYWKFDVVDSHIKGSYVDDGSRNEVNQVDVSIDLGTHLGMWVVPQLINVGATMNATITATELNLTFEGETTLVKFSTKAQLLSDRPVFLPGIATFVEDDDVDPDDDKRCGLFRLGIFCPFSGCNLLRRMLGRCG